MGIVGGVQPGGNVPGSMNVNPAGNMLPSNTVGFGRDMTNFSPDLKEGSLALNCPLSETSSGSGFPEGLGMVPGFGGATDPAGSMFGGMMEMMQKSQQDMMMMMLKMLEEMQKQNGLGDDQANKPDNPAEGGGGLPSGGGGSPSGGGGIPSGGGGSPSGGGGIPSGGGGIPSGGGGGSPVGGGKPSGGSGGSPVGGGGGAKPSGGCGNGAPAGGAPPCGQGGCPPANGGKVPPGNTGNNGVGEGQGKTDNDISKMSKEQLEEKIANNKTQQEEINGQLEPARQEKQKLEGEIKPLEEKQTALNKDITASKNKQTEINGEIKTLEGDLNKAQSELKAAQGKEGADTSALQAKVNEIEQKLTKQKEALQKEQDNEQKMQDELKKVTSELQTKKPQLEQANKKISELESKLKPLTDELPKLEEQLQKIQDFEQKLEEMGDFKSFLNNPEILKDKRTQDILKNNPKYAEMLKKAMEDTANTNEDTRAFAELANILGPEFKLGRTSGGGSFSTGNDAINLNINSGDPRTGLHEYGHLMDHKMGEEGKRIWGSDTKEARQTIQNDYNNSIKKCMDKYGWSKGEAEQAMQGLLRGQTNGNAGKVAELFGTSGGRNDYIVMSDTFAGTSNGRVQGAWKHNQGYYTDSNICLETFANMTYAGLGNAQALENMKRMMPDTYALYMNSVRNFVASH